MKTFLNPVLIAAVLSVPSLASAFDANNLPPTKPSGWTLKESTYTNVKIYQKGTENTYLQVVDMAMGARVNLMQYQAGTVSSTNREPTWWIGDISYWWNQMGSSTTSRVSVVNGQFFDNSGTRNPITGNYYSQKDPTTLSFGLKSAGYVPTNGGDPNANGGYTLKQMNFGSYMPTISDWTTTSLRDTSASNAIVGLDPRADKRSTESIGRTYLCTLPYYSNYLRQNINLLLIYSAAAKAQGDAMNDLVAWGCTRTSSIMMDGSGSTKLRTKGGVQFDGNDNRKIPQAIGIYN